MEVGFREYDPIVNPSVPICPKCNNSINISSDPNTTPNYVQALGKTYHRDCFTCDECGKDVSDDFCPLEENPSSSDPKVYCQRHYQEKMDLICERCNAPLDGLYVTGLGKKYHPQHFTCSVCPTEFGPDGTYYEHENKAYCLFHYTYLVSSKCSGCQQPIMKLYLQIYSRGEEERWHPECYMIYKFWNVRIRSPSSSSKLSDQIPASDSSKTIGEPQIYQIWTVLSSFEESTAACISDMLLQVSSGHYIEGLRQAERFIMHVDVLFASIDDLEDELSQFDDSTGLQHTREPKLLCKKIVGFFSVLSNTQTKRDSSGLTQELLSLVTSLAHYLKVLIRVALKGALKAEIEYSWGSSTQRLLNKLSETSDRHKWGLFRLSYQETDVSSDLCSQCNLTIETECIEHIQSKKRWHLDCFTCSNCNAEMQQVYPSSSFDPTSNRLHCPDCSKGSDLELGGFRFISQLEQYSFLMRVALKRLYGLLKYRSSVDVVGSDIHLSKKPALPSKPRNENGQSIPSKSDYSTEPHKQGYRKSSIHQALEEVASKRGAGSNFKTTKEDADYAFDVALQKIDEKFLVRKNRSKPHSAAEEAEAMGSKVKIVSHKNHPNHVIANVDRRRPRIAHVSAETLQARMRDAQENSFDSNSTRNQISSDKPSIIQRNKRNNIMGEKPNQSLNAVLSNSPHIYNSHKNSPTNEPKSLTYKKLSESPPELPAKPKTSSKNPLPIRVEVSTGLEHKNAISSSKPYYMSDLSPLELFFAKFAASSKLSALLDPSGTTANGVSNEILTLLGVSKKQSGSVWDKLRINIKAAAGGKKPIEKEKEIKTSKIGTFGVSLDILMERQREESTLGTHGCKSLFVPSFFEKMITTLQGMDLTIEGIFRKNGNIKRLREVSKAADKDHDSVNLHQDNSVQVAALLKKFCREIPDPLIPFRMRKLFLDINSSISNPDALLLAYQCAILLLPQPNRDMLNVLLSFLKSVSTFSYIDENLGSKMDSKNLAVVITPNIMYADIKESNKDDTYSFAATSVINSLIDLTPMVWQVPPTIVSFLRDRNLYSLKIDDELVDANSGVGGTLSTSPTNGNGFGDYRASIIRQVGNPGPPLDGINSIPGNPGAQLGIPSNSVASSIPISNNSSSTNVVSSVQTNNSNITSASSVGTGNILIDTGNYYMLPGYEYANADLNPKELLKLCKSAGLMSPFVVPHVE
ncbi:Rho-type GTPase-activating protein 1 [Smittium mucronatum]|uniref:Rho-type GTPase-activating protein 1 n=1 Tax=Smittium mucronatum TaxID=133383 RepID=A0A1R0H3G3_9FUNG|nr:Rho-type GTPase-activating protein 1 [Smittium mucronatum]